MGQGRPRPRVLSVAQRFTGTSRPRPCSLIFVNAPSGLMAGWHWTSRFGNRSHWTVPANAHFPFCRLVLFLLPVKTLMQSEIKTAI